MHKWMDRTTSTAFTVTRQSLLQCAKAAYCCFNTCEQQRRTGEYGLLLVYCINERVIRASLSFERKNVEIEVKLRWAAYQIVCIYGVTAILAREYAYTPCWIAGWHSELIASSYVFDTFFLFECFCFVFFFIFKNTHNEIFIRWVSENIHNLQRTTGVNLKLLNLVFINIRIALCFSGEYFQFKFDVF